MSDNNMVEATAVETTVEEKTTAAEATALATVQVKPDDGELMKLTQVPIIIEHLRKIKGEVESRTSTAINLVVTESNYKEIKKVRSAMNKEFAELETKRKDIKKAVMTPYEQFEAVYKECVAVPYKAAEAELKKKIAVVEDDLKAEKTKKVREHFDKYAQALGIDFVKFEAVGCQITMSVTEKKLKEQCTAFLDRVMDDLQLIATQEHKAEILVEYKRTLNVSQAIRTVKTADILYIDDFFKTRRGDFVSTADVNATFKIINYRYNEELPTIISSEFSLQQIVEIDEALGSRIAEMANHKIFIERDSKKNYRFRDKKVSK